MRSSSKHKLVTYTTMTFVMKTVQSTERNLIPVCKYRTQPYWSIGISTLESVI